MSQEADDYAKSLIDMTLEQLYAEQDRLEKTPPKEYDFTLMAKAEALLAEMKYRKYYQAKGYTRSQAGYLMAFQ